MTESGPRSLRIGIVCPYSFDEPGGVQFHIRDIAAVLTARGHVVSVLAPAHPDTQVPSYVVPAGRSLGLPYNGSIARLKFGFGANARVRRWLRNGHFDVVHIHEPMSPSLSLLALWNVRDPVVATFHMATERSLALHATHPLMRPSFEKIAGSIAVSEEARRTVAVHLRSDPMVIPNGVATRDFSTGPQDVRWVGRRGGAGAKSEAPVVAFLGRFDEPRKGLAVLAAAAPEILRRHPRVRFVVAGSGRADAARSLFGSAAANVEVVTPIDDREKAALLRGADVYVAPQIGGESFGIVLVEAMAAGAPVVASDLPAFRAVLADGAYGRLFAGGSAAALADGVTVLLEDPASAGAVSARARRAADAYDWDVIAKDIECVYDLVLGPFDPPRPA